MLQNYSDSESRELNEAFAHKVFYEVKSLRFIKDSSINLLIIKDIIQYFDEAFDLNKIIFCQWLLKIQDRLLKIKNNNSPFGLKTIVRLKEMLDFNKLNVELKGLYLKKIKTQENDKLVLLLISTFLSIFQDFEDQSFSENVKCLKDEKIIKENFELKEISEIIKKCKHRELNTKIHSIFGEIAQLLPTIEEAPYYDEEEKELQEMDADIIKNVLQTFCLQQTIEKVVKNKTWQGKKTLKEKKAYILKEFFLSSQIKWVEAIKGNRLEEFKNIPDQKWRKMINKYQRATLKRKPRQNLTRHQRNQNLTNKKFKPTITFTQGNQNQPNLLNQKPKVPSMKPNFHGHVNFGGGMNGMNGMSGGVMNSNRNNSMLTQQSEPNFYNNQIPIPFSFEESNEQEMSIEKQQPPQATTKIQNRNSYNSQNGNQNGNQMLKMTFTQQIETLNQFNFGFSIDNTSERYDDQENDMVNEQTQDNLVTPNLTRNNSQIFQFQPNNTTDNPISQPPFLSRNNSFRLLGGLLQDMQNHNQQRTDYQILAEFGNSENQAQNQSQNVSFNGFFDFQKEIGKKGNNQK